MKHRRNDRQVQADFAVKEREASRKCWSYPAGSTGDAFYTLRELAQRSSLARSEVKQCAEKLAKAGKLVPLLEDIYIHREELSFYQKKTEAFLENFHKENPLKEGMGMEEVRSRLNLGDVRLQTRFLKSSKRKKSSRKKRV